jgi:hypothetical protein
MEVEALEAVREANQEMIEARLSVHRYTSGALDQHEEWPAPAEEENEDALPSNLMEEVGDIENGAEGQKGSSHGLRHRVTSSVRSQWELAQSTAQEIQRSTGKATKKTRNLSIGLPLQSLSPLGHALFRGTKAVTNNASKLVPVSGSRSGKSFRTVLEHPTYAVVTFTSRQAAIAARQCLADGGGLDRWVEIAELPVTPLADAPPRKIMFCRGFCRPVTLTISDNEKMCRKYM